MSYKIKVLNQMLDEIRNDQWTTGKLSCIGCKTIDIGENAVRALIDYFEYATNCDTCKDRDMCDQVNYDCPKWHE